MIAARRLLKSCAIPPARRPTASIFCACRSWASRRLRSEVSSRIASVPIAAPAASRSRASEKRHSTQRPSRARISVSCSRMRSFRRSRRIRARAASRPPRWNSATGRPQHLVGPVAQELLGARAPVRDVAPHVGRDDSRRRVLRDGAEEVPGAARVLVEPRVADRQRGLADEALEQLPVLGVELEGRRAVQREDAEQRALVRRSARRTRSGGRAAGTSRPRGPARPRRRPGRSPPGGAWRPSPAAPRRTRCGGAGYVAAKCSSEKARGSSVRVASSATQSPTAGASISCAAARAISRSTSSRSERRGDEARQPREALEAREPPVGGLLRAAEPVRARPPASPGSRPHVPPRRPFAPKSPGHAHRIGWTAQNARAVHPKCWHGHPSTSSPARAQARQQ